MKIEPVVFPEVFNYEDETCKAVLAKKKSIKNFKFSNQSSLSKVNELAYLLMIFNRKDEAYKVCDFMSKAEFDGNFNLWSWVERTLALKARILREMGRTEEAIAEIKRIAEAGFVKTRIRGELLNNDKIKNAIEDNDKTAERDWRLIQLEELCFIIEVGKYSGINVEKYEYAFDQNMIELRRIFNV
ncbi:MAG: hypothetical protein KAZ87_05735 [Spirochaetes bacterium]|nr:hypothetical protein [Spirochaetota bacterium]